MNITSNYLPKSFNTMNSRIYNQPLRTNPSFGVKKQVPTRVKDTMVTSVVAAGACALHNGIKNTEVSTEYGTVSYYHVPHQKRRLDVTRPNGKIINLFEGVPLDILKKPAIQLVHQANSSEINPNVGVTLTQNRSNNTVEARKITIEGTLEENLVTNNMNNVPLKFDIEKDLQMINAPWSDQYVTQRCLMVRYGTVDESSYALDSYMAEYTNPETGKAPDVAILAAQKGVEDRSFVPADIAKEQYEIVLENGERVPCDYEKMEPGKVYMIAKKECLLKMAVPPTEVISSEDEILPANKLYMVDSMGHFYNGNPIKRIKSGEVTWNADMNDPIQAKIKECIDKSLKYEKFAKDANEKELPQTANKYSKEAKELTAKAEKLMTDYVLSAQNKNNEEFFA